MSDWKPKIARRPKKTVSRGKFTAEEDETLSRLVVELGENWDQIAPHFKGRNGRQLHDRYRNYLAPNLNKSPFSREEDELILEKYKEIGPKWVKMTKYFQNRTDFSLKNRWQYIDRRIYRNKKIVYPDELVPVEETPKKQELQQEEVSYPKVFALEPNDLNQLWLEVYGVLSNSNDPSSYLFIDPIY